MSHQRVKAFTLLEVLLALAIISIALTALLLVMGQSIKGADHVKHKTLAHLVGMQGLAMVQLKLSPLAAGREATNKLRIFDQTWFWHAKSSSASLPNMQRIEITVRQNESGPFRDPLIGFAGVP